ncbi:hypothetical protein BG57_18675 [Caballeronia grimmiae]|uniref:Uncharacterized protein n=2 Tax=Burkholderiaceae TaxID=119060 RepID=A0A069NN02_9BURK|nr:hypothetical protein BG57_18675 [Caballeronia grimmiae]GGD60925.1 hypothetical protein GCM10010985_13750 [Caballeronia grimmiae]
MRPGLPHSIAVTTRRSGTQKARHATCCQAMQRPLETHWTVAAAVPDPFASRNATRACIVDGAELSHGVREARDAPKRADRPFSQFDP